MFPGKEVSVEKSTTIAVDLAKAVFEVLNAFERHVAPPLDTPGRFEVLARTPPGGAHRGGWAPAPSRSRRSPAPGWWSWRCC